MKKIFTLLSFCAIFSNAQVFSENFNGNTLPAGWSVENSGSAFNWQVNNAGGFASFPSGAAFFDDDNAGPSSINSNAKIISPVINLSAASSPKLSFKYGNMIYNLDSKIKVEAYNGTSWIEVFSSSGASGTWGIDFNTFNYVIESYAQSDNIDLTPYKNANFRLRFIYDDAGDYSYGCVIDDIVITSGTLAVTNVKSPELLVYPNPANNFIHINSTQFINAKIYDLSGKIIKTFAEKVEKYDISDLAKGVYVLVVQDGEKTITKKIVKE